MKSIKIKPQKSNVMKKNLLHFIMLVLCTGIMSTQSYSQDVGGGEADGLMPDPGGSGFIAAPNFQPPSWSLSLKRNNGNGHCTGSALATLNIKGTFTGKIWMDEVAYKSTGKVFGSLTQADGIGTPKGSNVTFCLNYNIPPKNKLLFKFHYETVGGATGEFWIPEM